MEKVPPNKGREAVFLTWRVNARMVGERVVVPAEPGAARASAISAASLVAMGGVLALVLHRTAPESVAFWGSLVIPAVGLLVLARSIGERALEEPVAELCGVRRRAGRLVVQGAEADVAVGADAVVLRHGRVDVEARVVRTFGLPRWIAEQSDIVFPLVMVMVTVIGLQIRLLMLLFVTLFPPPEAPGPPEPSIEYLTRLLRGDTAGAEQGVVARVEHKVATETKIDSYYLPAGSAGPLTEPGGARRVGPQARSADPRTQQAEEAAIRIEELGATEALVPHEAPEDPDIDDLADPLASPDGEQKEQLESMETRQGFGLTDWYDTEDARRDRNEVERTIELAHELLRLDPDNRYGLSIKSYYQYLAMDLAGAAATYDRLLQLDGTDGATWNNLALIYKRKGEYQKEEELYATSLMMEPNQPNTYINLALCYAHQGRFDEALATMEKVEVDLPDDPYADLHRAKIYALMGKEEESYRFLRKALTMMRKLDTLHNIEFQQDIRVDPAFDTMRETPRFKKLLTKYYGDRPGGWWIFKEKEE